MNLAVVDVVYPPLSRNECRAKVQAIFDSAKVPGPINSLAVGTVNSVAYWSDFFNIHPALILATMELEQSILTQDHPLTDWSAEAMCGVVDQDTPGGRPDLLGIAIQVYRCARSYSWSMGLTPDVLYGRTKSWMPGWDRYKPGIINELYPPDFPLTYTPKNELEYSLLCFCPHLERLDHFQKVWDNIIPSFS